MNKSGEIGKKHVIDVCRALQSYLKKNAIETFSEPVQETVKYKVELYPNIQVVSNNYETDKPDFNPNLLLTLHNGEVAQVNLFYIKGTATIQPKNLGAKSFLSKYFLSLKMQNDFDTQFNKGYEFYLQSIIDIKGHRNVYDKIAALKNTVKARYPKFEEEINPFRKGFLFSLREYCFQLMKEEFNKGTSGIEHAFNELMMQNTTNIITRYTIENKCLYVEQWKSSISRVQDIQLYKKGNDTIGIRAGSEALTIRFKFESGPTSSIKLATSYEHFPAENELVQKNLKSIKNFEGTIGKHQQVNKKNDSNAVGKCNETMVYYRFLLNDPSIHQVDDKEFQVMLETYAPYVTLKTLLDIQQASIKAVEKIDEYLHGKYGDYEIAAIQLVPDSYIKDHLDTSDLKIIVRVDRKYVEENLSLKAISKSNVKITVKNPGAGSILGPLYFDVGSLALVTDEMKVKFEQQQLTHTGCLEKVSAELGKCLQKANQEKLRKGLVAIRGTATTVITYYTNDRTLLLEHDVIKGEIEVNPKSPTPIQTTLRWHEEQEELSLRVKFSAGQSKGWSSLKLACEYKVNV
ncbi:MAG: hypothetical protein RR651_05600 [Lysinibacillus sp.]